MVNQLGRHSINMEAFMGKDLDHLTELMTGALKEMHEERPVAGAEPRPEAAVSSLEKEGNREPPAAMQLNLKSDKGQDLNQKDTLRMKQQGACFFCSSENTSWHCYME